MADLVTLPVKPVPREGVDLAEQDTRGATDVLYLHRFLKARADWRADLERRWRELETAARDFA